MIKLHITESGKMILGKTPEKKVGFLHPGIAGLIDQPADSGAARFGHLARLSLLFRGRCDVAQRK